MVDIWGDKIVAPPFLSLEKTELYVGRYAEMGLADAVVFSLLCFGCMVGVAYPAQGEVVSAVVLIVDVEVDEGVAFGVHLGGNGGGVFVAEVDVEDASAVGAVVFDFPVSSFQISPAFYLEAAVGVEIECVVVVVGAIIAFIDYVPDAGQPGFGFFVFFFAGRECEGAE